MMDYEKQPNLKRMKEWYDETNPIQTYNLQRVVSMAACIVDRVLVVGNRHFCPIMHNTIELLGLDCSKHNIIHDQGFVCQHGQYMTREEAWLVAGAAGQIKRVTGEEGVLYSEDYLI